jgi:hypothetical protein
MENVTTKGTPATAVKQSFAEFIQMAIGRVSQSLSADKGHSRQFGKGA